MIWISFAIQSVWFYLLFRWTRNVGREMEVLRDQIARLASLDVETGKQLSDLWHTVQDLESSVRDSGRTTADYIEVLREGLASTTAKKPRRKK